MAVARPHHLTDLTAPSLFVNRELSWLEFNQRVLDQACADHHPLLERVKFLAIVGSNLDVFFMVRVATLLKKQRASADDVSPDGSSVAQQIAAIRQRTTRLMHDHAACWQQTLRPALAAHGITFVEPAHYTDALRAFLRVYFHREVFPLLTPLAFDRRVEALCRVRDQGLHRHIRDVVLEAYLRDDRAYVMSGGRYVLAPSAEPSRLNAQRFLLDWYTDPDRADPNALD